MPYKRQLRWCGPIPRRGKPVGKKIGRHFVISIDEPLELCGTNQYPNPQEYLLAATNACMIVGYVAVAALMGVKLTASALLSFHCTSYSESSSRQQFNGAAIDPADITHSYAWV